jgi:hypothetical protein
MTLTKPLSEIIRQVTEHVAAKSDYEQRVTINVRTGQAVPAPGLFETLTGSFRYFLVANNRDPQKATAGTKEVKYKQGSEEIVFVIDYRGGCPPGREMSLAQFFFKAEAAEKAIPDTLGKWLVEFFSSAGRTIDQFYSQQKLAALDLVTKASREFGLDLTITFRVPNPKPLETIEIGPVLFASRLKGCDEEESVWFKTDLEVDQQHLMRARLNQKMPFTELLKKGVRKYLADSVTLETFYEDLNSEQVKQGLRTHLNQLLKSSGRRITFISLKPDDQGGGTGVPVPYSGETIIEYKHHEYPDPIKIKISVLMIPRDPTRYKSKGSPKLGEWLHRNLEEASKQILFGVSYVDLLLGFADLKTKISEQMNRRAADIGYEIEQLMTMLYMEPFAWLKRIDIEIKSNSANEGSDAMFETNISNFYIGLEIFLTTRVKDLRGISQYLAAKQDVPQKMKEEIVRLVQNTLHATHPERFHARFSDVNEASYPNDEPLEAELRKRIDFLLKAEFNAEVIHLVLKPMETALTRKFEQVSRASFDFSATSELGTVAGAPQITVQGSFRVEAIHVEGWKIFQESEVSVEALRKRIEDSIRASLKCTPDDSAVFVEQEGLVLLIDRCLLAAMRLVQAEFGLSVTLSTISWDWEDRLKKIGQQRSGKDISAVQQRVASLNEELLDLYQYDGGQERIDEVKAAILRLNSTLPRAVASSIGLRELPAAQTVKALPEGDLDSGNPP